MFTNLQLVESCKKIFDAKWVYWYGTYGRPCTDDIYRSKMKQYPTHYTSDRTSGYKKDIAEGKWCADCVGMIKYFFWSSGVFGNLPKYASNNCPDVSANGMYKLCSQTGAIRNIPDEPGLVVWKSGHIGVYIGDGYTIEMRGFAYDCVKRKVVDGPWTNWGRLPKSMLEYVDENTQQPEDNPTPVPFTLNRVLKKGCKGVDVKDMQDALIKLGYDLGSYGADGDFGSDTQKAVKQFQKDHGLTVDGEFGTRSYATLILEFNNVKPAEAKDVLITGNSVNVRSAPNTDGRILGVAHKGDKIPYQGQTSDNGWYLVVYKGENAWISGKYSEIM